MATSKRNVRGSVVDLWHRRPKQNEQVNHPADGLPGPTWCVDKRHVRTPETLVCTVRHGTGLPWAAQWVDRDGQPRSKSFKKKAEAQAHLDATMAAINTGTYADPRRSSTSFGAVAESWISAKEGNPNSPNRSPKTIAGYRGLLDVVILPKWKNEPLQDITHERLQSWITWLSSDPAARKHPKRNENREIVNVGLSPARVIQTHQVIHQVFGYAIRAKYLSANPADYIELPRKARPKDLALTHEQVDHLANHITAVRLRQRSDTKLAKTSPEALGTMVRTMAYGGFRYGECAALRVGDIDIANRRMMASKSVTQVRGKGTIEGDTKNHQKQWVPILLTDLVAALAVVVEGRKPSEYLFPGPDGGAMTIGWFNARFTKAVAALGVPDVTPHTLRHSAGSLTISETPSATGLVMASKLLRHANVTTTANVYSHMFEGDWDKLATAMDNAVKPRPSNL